MITKAFRMTICAAAAAATALMACSDDRWGDTDIFRWPPLNAEVPHGSIKDVDGFAVLVLDGTNAEMGYAHGQLLGPYIILLIDNVLSAGLGDGYDAWRQFITGGFFSWPQPYEEELQGIVDGMNTTATGTWLPRAGRRLDVIDLKVWNAMYDLGGEVWQNKGQGFGAWKGARDNQGAPLAAWNFHTYWDPNSYAGYIWSVVCYQRDGVLTVAPPGFIGSLAGVSKRGVGVFASYAKGQVGANQGGTPMPLLLRDYLRVVAPVDADDQLKITVDNNMNFGSWNILGITPAEVIHDRDGVPTGNSWVLECDSVGTVNRFAKDVFPKDNGNAIFALKSHYVLPPPQDPRQDGEYTAFVDAFDHKAPVDDYEAWVVLSEVADFGNSHSVVFVTDPADPANAFLGVAMSDGETPAAVLAAYGYAFKFFRIGDFW